MRTSNPALSEKAFQSYGFAGTSSETMTVQGTGLKTGLLLVMAVVAASITWRGLANGSEMAVPLTIGGAIVGLIFALVTIFKKEWSPVTAPLYAIAEGLFLGGISAMYNAAFNGIVFQAVCLTFGTMFALLMAYQTGIIKVTEKFRAGIFAATGAICLVYLVSIVMNMFGGGIPYIHGNGMIGIGFSLFVVVIAALNLVLDFDFIEQASNQGAPKYMEWYGAFGLMVTLVWLYLEILRLLAKLQSRD